MTTPANSQRLDALLRWPTYAMGQLHRQALRLIDDALAPEGLSLRDYYVLVCLAEEGEMAQQQVADRLGMDRSDLVKLLDRLEDAGKVTRRRDTNDRRRHVLALTQKGQDAATRTAELCRPATEQLLGRLSEQEQQTLHTLLLKALGEAPPA
ncbi:MarR family winged helix-turn-helix transcriptional regulator [Actinomadura harenae]|uniref:MarR family transcriptional regulator n=1 Tax=Actinomadura harenae TaxID=2483351 RepID=A0A3M2LIT5_9ACTN|nr:MarR family winged helix-turn-helix transcriptional regulator [Actinomadura harenae]RMI36700.1 MarR family transcriptional regulator [Actinomadura harenae]